MILTLLERTHDYRHRQWTPEKEGQLYDLLKQGLSSSQMGAALGCSRNSIIGKVHRLGLRLAEAQDLWTDPEIQSLKTAWAKGISVNDVADEIFRDTGIRRTPHSISGKALRLGLTKRMVQRRTIRAQSYYTSVEAEKADMPADFKSLDVPFLKLNSMHCREVMGRGEDGLTVYCGHRKIKNYSFCAVHMKINYHKPNELRRSLCNVA